MPGCPRALKEVSVKGSFPSPDAEREDAIPFYEAAKAWIIANGHKDSLRSVVSANYGAGEHDAAVAAYEELRGDNRAAVAITGDGASPRAASHRARPYQTGIASPAEELGCVVIRRVKLATKPRRPLVVDEDRSE